MSASIGGGGPRLSPEEIREKLNLHWPRVSEAYNWMVDLSKAVGFALRERELRPEKVTIQWQGDKKDFAYWDDDTTAHVTKISATITLSFDCSVEITTVVLADLELNEMKVTITQPFPSHATLTEEKSFFLRDDQTIGQIADKVLRFVFSSIESFIKKRHWQANEMTSCFAQLLTLVRAYQEQYLTSINPQQ